MIFYFFRSCQDLLLHYGERLSMEARHGTVEVVDDLVTAYDTEAQES